MLPVNFPAWSRAKTAGTPRTGEDRQRTPELCRTAKTVSWADGGRLVAKDTSTVHDMVPQPRSLPSRLQGASQTCTTADAMMTRRPYCVQSQPAGHGLKCLAPSPHALRADRAARSRVLARRPLIADADRRWATSSGEIEPGVSHACFGECSIDEETNPIAGAEALHGRQMVSLPTHGDAGVRIK